MQTIASFDKVGGVQSPNEWLKALKQFNQEYEFQSISKTFPGFCKVFGTDVKKAFVVNLSRNLLYQNQEKASVLPDLKWGYNVTKEALCALRISMRENKEIEILKSKNMLKLFLDLSQSNEIEVIDNEIPLFALKCILNCVSQNSNVLFELYELKLFEKLIYLLSCNNRPLAIHQFVVRMLFIFSHFDDNIFQMMYQERNYDFLNGDSVIHLLITTLIWCIRYQDPPFPIGNQRALLANEILKLLYAIKDNDKGKFTIIDSNNENDDNTILSQLGIILCEILTLSHQDEKVFEVKLACINLLTLMEPEYTVFLTANNIVCHLNDILMIQIEKVTTCGIDKEADYELAPLLIVLKIMSEFSIKARKEIKVFIFPDEISAAVFNEELPNTLSKKEKNEKKIKPQANTPIDSLRGKMIPLMRSFNPIVSRCTGELLYLLCNENENEFTYRCGLGNTINLLRIKGLFNVPESQMMNL